MDPINSESREEKDLLVRPVLAPKGWMIFVALLVLYIVTSQPSLGWRDNPEFVDVAQTLGIAHPAGYPTYSLITKFFTFLPVASIPFRVTMGSALCGAGAVLGLFFLIFELGKGVTQPVRSWAAAGIALIFGLATPIWTNATEQEVYALNLLCLGVILYCALRWTRDRNEAWLLAGAFLYGVASGNHATVAFFLPGFLVYVLWRSPQGVSRRLLLVLAFFFIGLSVYVYLPIRALASTPFNYGDPETLERFFNLVTNKKASADNFSGLRQGVRGLGDLWVFMTRTVPWTYWVFGMPLALVGGRRLWKDDKAFLVALVLIALGNIAFFLQWTNPTAFLPTFYVGAMVCGLGAGRILEASGLLEGRARRGEWFLAGGLAMTCLALAWMAWPDRDRSRYYMAWETFRETLESLPPEAIALVGVTGFHHSAYQDVFRMREDVSIIWLSDLFRPDLFNPITARRYPRLEIPSPTEGLQDSDANLRRFVLANLKKGHEIFMEPFGMGKPFQNSRLAPALPWVFRFSHEPAETIPLTEVQKTLDWVRKTVGSKIHEPGFWEYGGLQSYCEELLFQYGTFFQNRRQSGGAQALYRFLLQLFGPEGSNTLGPVNLARLYVNVGAFYSAKGELDLAEKHFLQAVKANPFDLLAYVNLGQTLLQRKKYDEARSMFHRALDLAGDPKNRQAILNQLKEVPLEAGKTP